MFLLSCTTVTHESDGLPSSCTQQQRIYLINTGSAGEQRTKRWNHLLLEPTWKLQVFSSELKVICLESVEIRLVALLFTIMWVVMLSLAPPQFLGHKGHNSRSMKETHWPYKKVGKSVQDGGEECLIPEFAFRACMCLWTKRGPCPFELWREFYKLSGNHFVSKWPNWELSWCWAWHVMDMFLHCFDTDEQNLVWSQLSVLETTVS